MYELDGQALHTPSLAVAPTVGSAIFDGELNALPDVHVFTVMIRQRSAVLVDLNLPLAQFEQNPSSAVLPSKLIGSPLGLLKPTPNPQDENCMSKKRKRKERRC